MWIKPGQHGMSPRSLPGHHPPHQQAVGRRCQVRPQHWTASPPPAEQGTGTLAHPWKNGP